MKRLYFFMSTDANDELSTMTIFTNSLAKAFALARKAFAKNGYKGLPIQLGI